MEPLLDRPLGRFLEDLADETPAPGGGSAAAVAVAMAAGLLEMAARRSEAWSDAVGVAAQAEALRERVTRLAELNAEAYAEARAVLAEPADDHRLGTALSRAAAVPLDIAEVAADVAELGALVAERGAPELRADAVAAVLLADSAARVGANLVRVNLTAQADDERLARSDRLVEATAEAVRRALLAET